MSTLTANLRVSLVASLASALDLGAQGQVPLNFAKAAEFANGTGANQANQLFFDERTIAASSSEELDLAGSLTNAFGETITFTKVKGIVIFALAANTNNVVVGGAAEHAFAAMFDDAADELVIRPGGLFVLTAPNVDGMAVGAGASDKLKVANSSSGTGVTYQIAIWGVAS